MVVVDELGPLLVVVCQQEGVDVAQPDYWHADNKESLTKISISESILIIFELCGLFFRFEDLLPEVEGGVTSPRHHLLRITFLALFSNVTFKTTSEKTTLTENFLAWSSALLPARHIVTD